MRQGADIIRTPAAIFMGLPFAATLLGILFTHEMGHYVVGRLRRAPVSLPYFIPLPPGISFTGTMGAVIVQREPMEDRKTVLEIGIAGPLAGLAALVGVVLTSLTTSTLSGSPATPPVVANSIPAALDQIRNPANVLVAVVFGLSPGLVFSRFRQNVEQTKRELTRTSGATSVQSKRGT